MKEYKNRDQPCWITWKGFEHAAFGLVFKHLPCDPSNVWLSEQIQPVNMVTIPASCCYCHFLKPMQNIYKAKLWVGSPMMQLTFIIYHRSFFAGISFTIKIICRISVLTSSSAAYLPKHYICTSSWENWIFAYAKIKTQINCAVTAQLINVLVFATWIVQSLFLLYPTFQASSLFLRLYRPVCVRLSDPEAQFSCITSHIGVAAFLALNTPE